MRFLERYVVGAAAVLSALGSAGESAAFTNVAAAPIDISGTGTGASWVDFDADGDLDLLYINFNTTGARLFRNDGATFADITAAPFGFANSLGATWGDYDVDGDLDVFFNVGAGNNRLLRNDNGTFVDRTPATILDTGGEGECSWVDFDGDSDLDLWITPFDANAVLARNDGGDTFVNVTPGALSGLIGYGEGWGDYDNDGDMDLFMAIPGSCVLARNDGGTFVNVAVPPVSTATVRGGADWGDFDDDGDLDLIAADGGGGTGSQLFRNDRVAGFAEIVDPVVNVVGFGLSATWQDYDFDGDLDVLIGGNAGATTLARNDGGGSFARADSAVFAATGAGGGMAWGDYDGDGDVDLFHAPLSGTNQLLRNDDTNGNNWIHVELIGTKIGIVPIGARVTVAAGGRTQMRELAGSNGCGSQNSFVFEFGLGAATSASTVTIRWPSGEVQTLRNVAAGEKLRITEPTFVPAISSFTPGSAISLSFTIQSARVTSGTLMHRAAGSGVPFSGVALSIAGDQAFATVPASSLTEDGLEYFIDFRLSGGSRSVFEPADGSRGPAFLPASLNRSLTNVPASKQYVLFGVPFDPSNASASAVLEDELGAPNNKNWRFGRFNPAAGGYDEHPNPSLSLNGGQGFWLIMKDAVAVGTTGASRNPVGGFPITLVPGANMIAHPFLFPVTLADVDFSAAPSVEQRLVGFGAGSGYSDATTLEAWKGYWMFNNGGSAETIVIPGVRSAGARVAPPVVEPDGWWISVRARQGEGVDASNVAGVTRTDLSLTATEPPELPGYVRAYFENDSSGRLRALTRDVRAANARGAAWDLVVDGPAEETIHLDFEGLATVPADFDVVLVPELTFATIDLRERDSLVLTGESVHRFELVVGTSEYVESVRTGQERTPAQFALGLGYPNPLHGSTSVGFALPQEARVEMAVYDVQGRLVRTLISGSRPAGRHVVEWNARSNDERAVAPGVYFVKLRAADFDATRKLVVIR